MMLLHFTNVFNTVHDMKRSQKTIIIYDLKLSEDLLELSRFHYQKMFISP